MWTTNAHRPISLEYYQGVSESCFFMCENNLIPTTQKMPGKRSRALQKLVLSQGNSSGAPHIVAKPLHSIAKGKKGLIQPAVKCRGRA